MGYSKIVIYICAVAALGGLLFGLDQGFIANSLDTIRSVYGLSVHEGESYAAILASGGILGALLSGFFARAFGRKKSLIIAGFLFSSMTLVSAFLPSFSILLACRFGIGFAVGIASFIVPLYLSETAPAQIRGSMGSLFQLMITIGIFLIAASNVYVAGAFTDPKEALPIMFGVVAFFSLVMFGGSIILPESPRWLMLKGRQDEAIAVLNKSLANEEAVALEIAEIKKALDSDKTTSVQAIFKPYFIKVLALGIALQMFQQLVGINMMIYYAPTIFGYAGMTGIVAILVVPTVNMLFTLPAIRLVEKWGRKKLLFVGAILMGATMLAAGFAFSMIGTDTANASESAKTILLISIVIYIFGFAISWGPVVWLVCSEIFPLESREFGMTATTMVNWLFAGIVMGNALTFMHEFGNAAIFYLFAFFCAVSILFLKYFVPETKGVSLEEIELKLKSGAKLKDLGA